MKFLIYIMTAGNEVLFETLDSIKENVKIPYELCVFYHALNEENPVNLDIFNRITHYTDDVILATKNQKCPSVIGYGKVYKEYDYLLELGDDIVLKPLAVETMFKPFENLRMVGVVGEGVQSHKMVNQYQIDTLDNFPDWGLLINRECVNEVGGTGAFFPQYGFDALEWMQRVHLGHWKIVNYKGLFIHGGKLNRNHESRDKTKDMHLIAEQSYYKYEACAQLQFNNYNWWANKI